MVLTSKTADELAVHATELEAAYQSLRGRNLAIDMTRGKPAPDQLDLADGLFSAVTPEDCIGEGGDDYRNYGIGAGIPEARRFFAEYMDVSPAETIVAGNSSLSLMYETLANATLFGMPGGEGPWKDQGTVRFLCPAPGYDRHFAICQRLGIEMVTVAMTDDGPDMDAVEALVADDGSIKGIWCVPKYSNPTGAVYSSETVKRLASMNIKSSDFRILWDNAYAVHHLGDGPAPLVNMLRECEKAGNPDRVLMFGSTSKITLAGSGVGVLAASENNIADALKKMSFASIGPDKINQLRHVQFFGGVAGLLTHMDRLADLIRPKFEAVEEVLQARLGGTGVAEWAKPTGGYFVSVDVLDGCAAEVVRRAGDAGIKLTPAGASFPYGDDPRDRNIRLAPTMPSVDEIRQAMEVFCTCVEWVCSERLVDGN
jgi:DNA-binding transcriptional MocR family regulator